MCRTTRFSGHPTRFRESHWSRPTPWSPERHFLPKCLRPRPKLCFLAVTCSGKHQAPPCIMDATASRKSEGIPNDPDSLWIKNVRSLSMSPCSVSKKTPHWLSCWIGGSLTHTLSISPSLCISLSLSLYLFLANMHPICVNM